ncbi:ABC transporter ATP-binding protein [Hyphomicrobium sulfonivorans]|nr:ABC transporter ATP-binding protein [Hyphomicrobium sulfonivorans]NSL71725.1 ABC transporter ATP-binding protein [Hyphomicrobium sulfonivorans]
MTVNPARKVLLEASGITKVFGTGAGQVMPLKGVDLKLYSGELTLLMGPSGSGKTTLLSILGCILSPTDGELTVAGQSTLGADAERLADIRRNHVGFVFQSYNLFPTMTARENVMLALDVRSKAVPDPNADALRALEAVGLSHRAHAYPAKLSGGEKQRVAIARALAGSPAVILADEPTAALDAENGRTVMALLSEVAKDTSRAVLAVTHDHRTLPYADRIILIDDGRIESDERPDKSDNGGGTTQIHISAGHLNGGNSGGNGTSESKASNGNGSAGSASAANSAAAAKPAANNAQAKPASTNGNTTTKPNNRNRATGRRRKKVKHHV